MAPPRISLVLAALLLISRTASALQVTPNSPCASICQDEPQFDISAPKSSNTKNSDIFCKDAFHAGATGSKWKSCMSCLQNSTYSQGGENDMMWFLYNLRYSLAYCVFAYPNATEAGSTPCSTAMACGPLEDTFAHGIVDQKGMTAFSYCQQPGATEAPYYERCVSCVGAEGKTEYLANYVIALEAGCLQQPAIGGIIGLNDTIFAPNIIKIVDPLSLAKAPEEKGLAGGTIAGIAGGALALLVILSAISFVCYRKRKNRKARADFEAGRSNRFRHRHQSSISFQCQTHAMSPRFWPGGDEATPVNEQMTDVKPPQQPSDLLMRRSSLWKPHNSISSFENTLDTRSEKTWTASPYQDDLTDDSGSQKKGAIAVAVPLENISTGLPAMPRSARMSPSSNMYNSPADIRTPMSAESVRSTSALLPGIKPYVPAEHGVHSAQQHQSPTPSALSTFSSPGPGHIGSPLLNSYGWPDQRQTQQQPQPPQPPRSRLGSGGAPPTGIGIAISTVPPPSVPWINAPGKKGTQKKHNIPTGTSGRPVESWEVQTAFDLPPATPKR